MPKMTRICVILFLLTISLRSMSCGSEKRLIEDDMNGLIASLGDFDSDKLTDVFVITENGKALEILKGYPTEPVLRKWPSIKCSFAATDETIVGVIPADFSGRAMMDVMVVTMNQTKERLFNIWLFKGNVTFLDCLNTSKPLVSGVKNHPMILDYNGDMVADFIVETNTCQRQLWTRSPSSPFQGDCPPELKPKSAQEMRFPNSNAFINLNDHRKDYTADIFISGSNKMEYWHNDKGFSPDSHHTILHEYPNDKSYKYLGQSAFVDINTDGLIDHILPVCSNDLTSDHMCKDPQILAYHIETKEWIVISDFNNGNHSSALTFDEVLSVGQTLPVTLRHGDIDGDGYSDLITVMKDKNTKAVVLKNIKGDNKFNRKFVIDWTSDKSISPDVNVEIATFVDLFEDGKIDILMTTKDSKDKRKVEAVLNTQMVAACFLKVVVTSGLCYGSNCPRGNIPYGTNQMGSFVCYELQDLEGNWQTGCAGQLSQSAHSALQMPYSVFGLGETPNFVETVTAAIPSGRMASRSQKWTQIVPDAQVVLIPFPPNDTTNWVSKLFYTPSNIVFSTLITLASICCILVLIIGILHRKELLEDLAEHEEYKRHWPESR